MKERYDMSSASGHVFKCSGQRINLWLLMQCVDFMCVCAGNGYVCRPDLSAAAHHFIKAFRNGELGRLMLDTQELTSVGS
jgi:hypothetical protein